jgi:endonuclease III
MAKGFGVDSHIVRAKNRIGMTKFVDNGSTESKVAKVGLFVVQGK